MSAEILVGLEQRMVPVTTYREAYYWRCNECGWLGTGCYSTTAAMNEAGAHWREQHDDPLALPPTVERVDMRKLAIPDPPQ